uniref:U4/U6.U5 small nuclear ribonucleoprotein 27 kDa protein n=1 Tax=Oryzias melastigma TaxID=30732 RepID=A0A3B3DVW0_ORYME
MRACLYIYYFFFSSDRRRSRSTSRERERRRRDRDRSHSRDRDRDRDRRRTRSRSPHRRRSRTPPRRHRSSSLSPSRQKQDDDRKDSKAKSAKPIQISAEDMQGKTEEEIEMMKLMGFSSFDSTKGKKTDGSVNAHATNITLKRKYRYLHNTSVLFFPSLLSPARLLPLLKPIFSANKNVGKKLDFVKFHLFNQIILVFFFFFLIIHYFTCFDQQTQTFMILHSTIK